MGRLDKTQTMRDTRFVSVTLSIELGLEMNQLVQAQRRPQVNVLEHQKKVSKIARVARHTSKLIRIFSRNWHDKVLKESFEAIADLFILVVDSIQVGEVWLNLKFDMFLFKEGRVDCE